MSARNAAWILVVLAYFVALAGALPVALFLALAVTAVYLSAPTREQRDARFRNQARRR